ncbi:MAG TPA: hypothetical protein VGO97_06150 [Solirubrobacterales bacterium]|jgi:hypothetical protein|nr:hypothetical protein [Solirubrobacterales bacterium]
MSTTDTKAQLEEAGRRFIEAVPALATLALVVKVDLQAKGDHQQYRLLFPGPEVVKDDGSPAMVELLIMRQDFNQLLDPRYGMKEWSEAFDQGKIKASGGGMLQLIQRVIEKQQRRHGG